MLEIEIKIKISALPPIKNNILAIGGVMTEALHEHDLYYNAPHRDFGETDEALRIRQTENKTIVTYKGPKDTILGTKIREEINLSVESAESFEKIITKLGFKPVAEVKKQREYYQLEDFCIALDEVEGLGSFVEIELITDSDPKAAAERIDALAQKLQIKGDRIVSSYLELLLSKYSII